MKLVIVESPTKCKTFSKYLGDNYKVVASLGHVRDLSIKGKGGLGVDIDNNFEPSYTVDKKAQGTVKKLKADAKASEEVILATDPDREGEAIAWHLADVLGLDVNTAKRLDFHEITRDSISKAINNPRHIDMNMVASQEARRIIDRIVGFKVSSLLQKNIKARSAGRVQSATLKLICDHERLIEAFVSEEYWTLKAEIEINNKVYELPFDKYLNKKYDLKSKEDLDKILALLTNELKVISREESIKLTNSKPPFITSTLQQEAFNKFRFSTKKTAMIAQKLYEGIDIDGEHFGLITYMRTDSTNLSESFITRAKNFISSHYGEEYIGASKKKKVEFSQDAHEAIRPSSNNKTPESVKAYLSSDEFKLYKLIYNRALASLMVAKQDKVTKYVFECNGVTFKYETTTNVYKGYTVLDDVKNDDNHSFDIEKGTNVKVLNFVNEQKFTLPPTRFSEAKVVSLMESKGIGRPSTYSSTISTLKSRAYITIKDGLITPTEMGLKTSLVLEKYFTDLVDADYTAKMETVLDETQHGEKSRTETINKFYIPFKEIYEKSSKEMYKDDLVKTGEKCPECGHDLVKRSSRYGEFVGCSNYPDCKYIKSENKPQVKVLDELCPQCNANLVERTNKKGQPFIGCSRFPKCNYMRTMEGEVIVPHKKKFKKKAK